MANRGKHCRQAQEGAMSDGPGNLVNPDATQPMPGMVADASAARHAREGRKAAAGQAPTAQIPVARQAAQASSFSRDSAGYAAKKAKRPWSLGKRIGVGIAIALAVVVGAAGAYAVWFSSQLNNALSSGSGDEADINAVTADVASGEPFYMLVLGCDNRADYSASDSSSDSSSGRQGRSDVMILTRIDPGEKKVTMVSIPRDTPIDIDGSTVKMNEAYHLGGPALAIEKVSELTGVSISHYAECSFADLEEMVDDLGGVTVDVDTDLGYKDALTGEYVSIAAGTQTLDGQQAQIFARARHEYATDQDGHRQSNVRALAEAMVKQLLDEPVYQIPNTILKLAGHVGTDLRTGDLLSLASAFSGDTDDITFYSCTGPTDGDFMEEYGGTWFCYENPEAWAALMAVVDEGGDPSTVDLSAYGTQEVESADAVQDDGSGYYVAEGTTPYDSGEYYDEDAGGTYYYGDSATDYTDSGSGTYTEDSGGTTADSGDDTGGATADTPSTPSTDTGGDSGGTADTGGGTADAPAADSGTSTDTAAAAG